MSLTREEKERILRAVEEDREFRFALMGLLGFREILEAITDLRARFARLEERQQKLEELFARLEERQLRLEERQQKLEELFARLEERQQKLEERMLRLEERQQRLEELFARLEERQQRLEERMLELRERQQRLEERMLRLEERQQKLEERMLRVEESLKVLWEATLYLRRTVDSLAHRFGVLSEEAFREAMKYVVEEQLGAARVEKWVYRDEEGIVYGRPSIVEADVVVRDNQVIIVEVKSRVDRSDVAELWRIGLLYEKVTGRKPKLLIIGGFMGRRVRELAESLGVELRPITSDAATPTSPPG